MGFQVEKHKTATVIITAACTITAMVLFGVLLSDDVKDLETPKDGTDHLTGKEKREIDTTAYFVFPVLGGGATGFVGGLILSELLLQCAHLLHNAGSCAENCFVNNTQQFFSKHRDSAQLEATLAKIDEDIEKGNTQETTKPSV